MEQDKIKEVLEKIEAGDLDMAKAMLKAELPEAEQGPMWPRQVYGPDGQPHVANDEEEEKKILGGGEKKEASASAPAEADKPAVTSEENPPPRPRRY